MSVVVYKNGVMAADTRAYGGDAHPVGSKHKIHRLEDGSLLGITSNVPGQSESLRAWINNGCDSEDMVIANPSFSAIWVKTDGSVWLFWDSFSPAGPLTGEFFTIGSGRKYAMGALELGVEVEEAVAVAIKLDL